eukprot:12621052-Prorocentrum_lima.AAC.1
MGTSCRVLVASLLLGVEDLVAYIYADPHASTYYLAGFSRLAEDRRLAVVMFSMCSRVAESILQELLEDPRVAQRYATLWATMSEELRWLVTLEGHIWHALGRVAGLPPGELASRCIAAGHTSYHFFWRRVLEPASTLPWSLCRGSVEENLRVLKGQPEPSDPVSSQLWHLLQVGFPMQQLVATIVLLGEVSWTTLPAEQQHASLARLKKWHSEYGAKTLVARAM